MLKIISRQAAWFNSPPAGSEEAAKRKQDELFGNIFGKERRNPTEELQPQPHSPHQSKMSPLATQVLTALHRFKTFGELKKWIINTSRSSHVLGFGADPLIRFLRTTYGIAVYYGETQIASYDDHEPISLLAEIF